MRDNDSAPSEPGVTWRLKELFAVVSYKELGRSKFKST